MDLAGFEGSVPAKLAHSQREPHLGSHLDHIWRGAARVTRAFDALGCTQRRHTNLNRVAWDALREVFQQVDERLADGRQFLVGDRFTAADLTFAALASPVNTGVRPSARNNC